MDPEMAHNHYTRKGCTCKVYSPKTAKQGFSILAPLIILDWTILCYEELSCVFYNVYSIPGFYPVDASSISLPFPQS